MIIASGTFGKGFAVVWHYAGYVVGGLLAAGIALLAILFVASFFIGEDDDY